MSPPTGHHTLSMVRRFPEAKGRNSRNSAPSTGRFPPTPIAMTEYMAQTLGVCVRNCFTQRSITGGNINIILPGPGRTSAHGSSENAGEKECHVECQTASNQIRRDTPETSPNTQSNEQCACCKSYMRFGNTELQR